MKIINNIEDLRRIYRNKDLLEINEIPIDVIQLISNYLGEEKKDIENKIIEIIVSKNIDLTKNIKLNDFKEYLVNKTGEDIYKYLKQNSTLLTLFKKEINESK
jgi:hypothetical protein